MEEGILNRINTSAALLAKAFQNRHNSQADITSLRQLDTIAKGFDSVTALFAKVLNSPQMIAQRSDAYATLLNKVLGIQDAYVLSGKILALGDAVWKVLIDALIEVSGTPTRCATTGGVPSDARVRGNASLVSVFNKLSDMRNGSPRDGQLVMVGEVLLQLLRLDPDADTSRAHGDRIADAAKEVKSLVVQQADTFFNSLLARTVEETPKIKEFFQQTGLPDLTERIVPTDACYIASGGYADVYKLTLWQTNSTSRVVVVKVFRVYANDIKTELTLSVVRRRLRREIHIWAKLHHENIVPLLGLTHRFNNSPFPSMVCPWMEGGTLRDFLSQTETTITLEERFRLLSDIISGLSYLHSEHVIHGDLTSSNVLLNQNRAYLSDFGLAKIISEFPGTSYMTSQIAGATRWAAPELYQRTYDHNNAVRPIQITKACDIYSYGCITQEVMSGELPYFNISPPETVILHKIMGIPPHRPTFLTDDMWSFIQLCWRDIPEERPEASQVPGKIKNIRQRHSSEELKSTLKVSSVPTDTEDSVE